MSNVTWVRRQRALKRFWGDFRTHKAGVAGLVILVLAVVLALIVPLFIDSSVTNVVSGTREKRSGCPTQAIGTTMKLMMKAMSEGLISSRAAVSDT